MTAPFYANQSTIGVDLNNTNTTAQFSLGQRISGSGDTLWVYCQMNGAATTGHICTIGTGGTATPAITGAALVAANAQIAFAQGAFADADYGWLCQHGNNVYIRVSGTCSLSQALYIATTSGCLHVTSASSTLGGVAMIANVSSTATSIAVLANLTWPRFMNAGQ
tara:strand:- start:4379 stop:4873 length:495 start_codon:yes stop_codon:yes gene_type:complete